MKDSFSFNDLATLGLDYSPAGCCFWFFAGTAAYYRAEINLWMQPENHGSQYDANADNQQLILKV